MIADDSKRLAAIGRFVDVVKKGCLSADDNASAVSLAEEYGHLLWRNPLGVYRDDTIENELIRRFKKLVTFGDAGCTTENILHVISGPYSSGGHTRLLERLASILPDSSDVLVTRPYSTDIGALRLSDGIKVICRNEQYSIAEMAGIIACYKTVVMYIHPDDISAAVSIGLVRQEKGLRVIFVNHADHAFSYGLQFADIVAEVSSFGMALSREKRFVPSSFLGIPLEMAGLSALASHEGQSLNIFSGGSPAKYKPSNGYSFPALAIQILREIPTAKITVIGPIFKNYWWWLPKILFPRRLTTCPVLPYEKYKSLVARSDVYIDSLPMAGGTALPEARSQGLPVTGIFTGAIGYTPFDSTKFDNIGQLITELKKMSHRAANMITERNSSDRLISEARQWHGMDAVEGRFKSMLEGNCVYSCERPAHWHDIAFYEIQWREAGVMNVRQPAYDFVFGLKGSERIAALLLLARALNWRQRLAFPARYLNFIKHSLKLK